MFVLQRNPFWDMFASLPQFGNRFYTHPSKCCVAALKTAANCSMNGKIGVNWDFFSPKQQFPFQNEIPNIQTTGPQTTNLPLVDMCLAEKQTRFVSATNINSIKLHPTILFRYSPRIFKQKSNHIDICFVIDQQCCSKTKKPSQQKQTATAPKDGVFNGIL